MLCFLVFNIIQVQISTLNLHTMSSMSNMNKKVVFMSIIIDVFKKKTSSIWTLQMTNNILKLLFAIIALRYQ